MESFIGKCIFGGILGIVYDLCGFLFLKALLPTSVLDIVLIAAPILFAAGSMLTEVTVVAEEKAGNEKCIFVLWGHVFVILVVVTVGLLLRYIGIVSSIFAIFIAGIFTIVIVEAVYRPGILIKWNKFCAITIVVFMAPILMMYLVLLVKAFLLFVLVLIVCSMLLIDTYRYN